MPRPAKTTAAPAERSSPTDGWLPCPDAALFHPQLPCASRVWKGPKAFWTECPVCASRRFVAPRLLRTSPDGVVTITLPNGATRQITTIGYTFAQIQAQGLTPL